MSNIILKKDERFISELNDALKNHQSFTNWESFSLLYDYKKNTAVKSFKELQSLAFLPHVSFLQHQVEAAERVINEMNGRAILADEVGLGKTIEAGLILKEYLFRNLVKKVLILVPSSLVQPMDQRIA